jgi:hypothetical protein
MSSIGRIDPELDPNVHASSVRPSGVDGSAGRRASMDDQGIGVAARNESGPRGVRRPGSLQERKQGFLGAY